MVGPVVGRVGAVGVRVAPVDRRRGDGSGWSRTRGSAGAGRRGRARGRPRRGGSRQGRARGSPSGSIGGRLFTLDPQAGVRSSPAAGAAAGGERRRDAAGRCRGTSPRLGQARHRARLRTRGRRCSSCRRADPAHHHARPLTRVRLTRRHVVLAEVDGVAANGLEKRYPAGCVASYPLRGPACGGTGCQRRVNSWRATVRSGTAAQRPRTPAQLLIPASRDPPPRTPCRPAIPPPYRHHAANLPLGRANLHASFRASRTATLHAESPVSGTAE